MQICYIDESGDLGAIPAHPLPTGNDQPVFVLGGVILDVSKLEAITNEFLSLKYRFFPGLNYPSTMHLDRIIPEIKGADLRRDVTRGTRNEARHALGFLDKFLTLLETYNINLIARIWVKVPGSPFDGRAVYTSSIQILHEYFDHYLNSIVDTGFCIADSRNKPKNVNVSHSIFTQKFQAGTSTYSRVIELPTFGHSDNHACLQMCDIICSSILFPISCLTYCTGHITNVHVQSASVILRQRYGQRIKNLQYRYLDPTSNKYKGGIVVADSIGRQSSSLMF